MQNKIFGYFEGNDSKPTYDPGLNKIFSFSKTLKLNNNDVECRVIYLPK